MEDWITVETDMFEHREVKPHFINPCCFGEDFAGWLRQALLPLADFGFTFSSVIQEDYGWGFWISRRKDPFWVALSYVGKGPQDPTPQWVITVTYEPGLNLIKRIFHRPDARAFAKLRDQIWQILESNSAITTIRASAI